MSTTAILMPWRICGGASSSVRISKRGFMWICCQHRFETEPPLFTVSAAASPEQTGFAFYLFFLPQATV